jgi:hypothetical protein
VFLPDLILIAFNILNCFIDAYKIKNLGKNIKHGINFGSYLVVTGLCIWLFHMSFLIALIFSLSAFFNRQITFDIPLNLRRGLDWDYVSLDNPPKAITDRIEVWLFGYNGRTPTIIYGILWLLTLIIKILLIKHQ